ncbi:MAG: chromosome segregation protein SMC [Candidatus Electrothrix sp. GM3_4]|nr:chromosome segregation protein SMC [Candidatus Electrothrix sp. GM3_4]
MITQLEIKNFRGFSEYKIEDIGQVNLLVGTNNCGKTSILEAVHLLKSRGDAAVLFSLLSRRGERIQNEERMSRRAEGDVRRLFHGFQLIPKSSFVIRSVDHAVEELSVSVHEIQPTQLSLFKELTDSTGQYQLNVNWGSGKDKSDQQKYPISYTGGLSYQDMRRIFYAKPPVADSNVEFIPASSLSPQKVVALFDQVVLTPDEELVLKAVRIVEPDIIRLASLGGGNLSPGDHVRGGIIVKSNKWEERIPIGSLGDGIWRLLGLILSLVESKNGILLIDEIDTGLHHTVMSKMWKLICVTARKLNVQVFATTHSSDCWKTLADNAVEDEFVEMPIRIHRIDKDRTRPETFTNQEMHLALNREIEVR